MPDKEMLRRKARVLYELAAGLEEMGQSFGEFVYDEEHDLFRFADGEFAFSREYLNEKRTFSWLSQNRRMSKDYERLCSTSESFVYAAMSRLMVRRLTRS